MTHRIDASKWPGPLFYPPVGGIAVMISGSRIEVWANEGADGSCFTGIDITTGDASVMWLKSKIKGIEVSAGRAVKAALDASLII